MGVAEVAEAFHGEYDGLGGWGWVGAVGVKMFEEVRGFFFCFSRGDALIRNVAAVQRVSARTAGGLHRVPGS